MCRSNSKVFPNNISRTRDSQMHKTYRKHGHATLHATARQESLRNCAGLSVNLFFLHTSPHLTSTRCSWPKRRERGNHPKCELIETFVHALYFLSNKLHVAYLQCCLKTVWNYSNTKM